MSFPATELRIPSSSTRSGINNSAPSIPLISNLTGKEIEVDEITRPSYWLGHTRNTVRFADGVKSLFDSGYRHFIEIGPQPILLGMAEESSPEDSDDVYHWLPSLRSTKDDWVQLLESLGAYYTSGGEVDWLGSDPSKVYESSVAPI